ncbi:MAG: hypothetical protein WD926_00060 [Patescibacteria group bacterium]
MDNLDEEINQAAADAQDVAYHQASGETAAAASTDNVTPQPVPAATHRLRNALIGLSAIVLAGTAFAAWFFLLRATPERILGQMVRNMETVRAFEYDLDMKGEYKQTENAALPEPIVGRAQAAGETFDYTASMQGVFDERDEDNPRVSVALGGSVSDGTKTYEGALEARQLKNKVYVQLTKAPDEFKQYVTPFLGQWIEFEEEFVEQTTGQAKGDGKEITEKESKEIVRILKETGALTLKNAGSESLDGDSAHVIEYRLDKEGLKEAAPRVYRIVEGEDMPDEERKSFEDGLKSVTFEPGKIMVDKRTKLLRKAAVGLSALEDGTSADTEITLQLKNFDDKVGAVEVPEGSVTLEELMARLEEDTDRDGLSYYEEITYGSDPSKRDTDGDSYPDGAEVRRGYNPAGPGRLKNDALGSGLLGGSGAGPGTQSGTPGPGSSSL